MSIPERTPFTEANGRINSAAGDGTPFEIADRDRISITFDADGGDYSFAISNDGNVWITTAEQLTGVHLLTNSPFAISAGPAPMDCKCIPVPCAYIRFVTVSPGTSPSAVALSTRF